MDLIPSGNAESRRVSSPVIPGGEEGNHGVLGVGRRPGQYASSGENSQELIEKGLRPHRRSCHGAIGWPQPLPGTIEAPNPDPQVRVLSRTASSGNCWAAANRQDCVHQSF